MCTHTQSVGTHTHTHTQSVQLLEQMSFEKPKDSEKVVLKRELIFHPAGLSPGFPWQHISVQCLANILELLVTDHPDERPTLPLLPQNLPKPFPSHFHGYEPLVKLS